MNTRLLQDPRLPRTLSLLVLLYFAAEWVVAATWRGFYSYRTHGSGQLGVAFCGPEGNWPCSALYPAFNISAIVAGVVIVLIALCWQLNHQITMPHSILLIAAGAGLAASGVITQGVDYAWHLTAASVFQILGAAGVFLVGSSASSRLARTAMVFATVAGVVGMVGYFAYVGNHTALLGPGGTQRVTVYAVLAAVVVLACVTRVPAAAAPAPGAEGRDEVRV